MNKLILPTGDHWAVAHDLQIRLEPIKDSVAVEAHLRTVEEDKNWHGAPLMTGDIIVEPTELVDFLNAHYKYGNIVGYRYYGGAKSKLQGVMLPELKAE